MYYTVCECEGLFIFKTQSTVRIRAKEEGMPIVIAPSGRSLRIVRIAADEKTKKHLENLGITVNGEITVLSASGGSVVCKVKDGRIALDRDVSTKIFVA